MEKPGKESKTKRKSTTQKIDRFVQVKQKPWVVFIVVVGLVDRRSHYSGTSSLILDIKRLKIRLQNRRKFLLLTF